MIKDITATCSNCHKKYQSSYENVINVQKNPELIEKILSGELFVHTCPHCHEERLLITPLYYVDHENKILIYCDDVEDVLFNHECNKKGIEVSRKPEGTEGYKEIGITDPRQFSTIYYSFKYGYDWRILNLYLAVSLARFRNAFKDDPNILSVDCNTPRIVEDEDGKLCVQLLVNYKGEEERRSYTTELIEENYKTLEKMALERINVINPYVFDPLAAVKFCNQFEVDLNSFKNATQTILFCEDKEENPYICRLSDRNKEYKMEEKITIITEEGEIKATVLMQRDVGILDFPRDNEELYEIKEED